MYKRGVVLSGVVSLTMGNSAFPLGHRLTRYVHLFGQFFLRPAVSFPQSNDLIRQNHTQYLHWMLWCNRPIAMYRILFSKVAHHQTTAWNVSTCGCRSIFPYNTNYFHGLLSASQPCSAQYFPSRYSGSDLCMDFCIIRQKKNLNFVIKFVYAGFV